MPRHRGSAALTQQRKGAALMLGLVVRFDLSDEESAARFDRLTAEAVAQIKAKEPGTLAYITHVVAGQPLSRLFYELYADEVAFQRHEEAQHVIDFHARKNPLLAGEPSVQFLTPGSGKGLPTT
jgi:quinol monooxygenase YgiN